MGREAVAVQRICPSSRAATTGALRVKWQLSSRCTTTTKGKSRRTSFRGARRPSTLSNCTTAAATTSTTRSPQTTFPRSTRAGGATGKTKSGISRRCGRRWVMTPHFLCRCNDCPGFVSHGWRTSCVKCRCPRTSHEIGTRNWVLGFERLGLEPLPSHAASGSQGQTSSRHFAPMVLEGYAWSPPVSEL